MVAMQDLPVDRVLPELLEGIRSHGSSVLLAPPGAGKSTRVPPAFLSSGLLGDGQLWMLQPRRAAAKLVARRIAEEVGCSLGQDVGYSVRFESARSKATRIEVLTEGLLTRRLQSDPFLEGVSCVVFDEFHERSLHADLAFSLLRDLQKDARPDLKILVMSATLDPSAVSAFLDNCPIFEAKGRAFPVDIAFEKRNERLPVWKQCAAEVRKLIREEKEGHMLVFLPGVGEITRAEELLSDLNGVDVMPLHGRMKLADQERALAPSRRRKVILSTNIAESAVTIEGVRAVVDSGLVRQSRFEPTLGFSRLELVRISQASADQRAGRAGRTGPGRCVRVWSSSEHQRMPPFDPPEIGRSDMSGPFLELLAWGNNPDTFSWFDPPKQSYLEQARQLLENLKLIEEGRISKLGQEAMTLPLHPRLASFVLCCSQQGLARRAVTVAALLSEPDVFRRTPKGNDACDIELRLNLIESFEANPRNTREIGGEINRRSVQNCIKVRRQILDQLKIKPGPLEADSALFKRLLVEHFPERVGARRNEGSDRYRLAGGQGIILDDESLASGQSILLALGIRAARRGERADHRVSVAMALDLDEVETQEGVDTYFDRSREAVVHRNVRRLGHLVVSEHQANTKPDPLVVAQVLAEAVAKHPERVLKLDKDVQNLLARLRFLREVMPTLDLPGFSELKVPSQVRDDSLILRLCFGLKSFEELRKVHILSHLESAIGFQQMKQLDTHAPARLKLPNGTYGQILYDQEGPPILAARVQQLFGLKENPMIASGKVALLLHILAPNRRPVQVTQDLEGFWRTTYEEVRKDLRGRYPKHPWPEDPMIPIPPRPRRKP